jgi:sugar lactone lactonase YvrE
MVDGDLVVADEGNGALKTLTRQGGISVLLGSIPEPNSIAIHEDGWIYTTAMDQVWKVDPVTGAASMQWELSGTDLDGLVFTNDYEWLYFNHDEEAMVGKAKVLANGDLEQPQLITNLIEGAAELDGMAMDACDNLYILFTDGRIKRMINDTVVEDWAELTGPGGVWSTSLHFGSGYGDFYRDHVYVMNRNGSLFELAAGIEGKPEPHLAGLVP